MSSNGNENGWNEYSKLVLKELETLADGIQGLNDSMGEVRKDILRLETKESKVDELRAWKDRVDEVYSPSQMKELRDKVSKHETFMIRAVTVLAVIQFLMGVAVVVAKVVK